MTGWGQDGPLAQRRRPRHQLHRARRRARALRARRAASRRRRSTWSATSAAAAMFLAFGIVCGVARGARSGQGQVVDAAMVDGARRAHGDDVGHRADRLSWNEERGANLLDTGAPFYDIYETADGKYIVGRRDRAAVLRRAARSGGLEGRGPARADGPGGVAALRERFTELFKTQDARRVVRDLRGHRRLLRAGAHHERGAGQRAHHGARHDRRARRRRRNRRRRRASRARPARVQRPAPEARRSTPTRSSPTGASAPTRSRSSTTSARSRRRRRQADARRADRRRSARSSVVARRRCRRRA